MNKIQEKKVSILFNENRIKRFLSAGRKNQT